MSLQKERTYMVLNYNSSPISLSTKNGSYLLESGTRSNPSVIPMTIDEIVTANTNGYAFKYGFARFEKEFQEDIYKELRLHNWKDILTDEEIEDIIINPTAEGLERLIAIDDEVYFERVVGVYYGLKSIFADISPKVAFVIEQRKSELHNNKRKTEIVITKNIASSNKTEVKQEEFNNLKAQNEELAKQLEEMQKKFEELMKSQGKSDNGDKQIDLEKESVNKPKTTK